MVKLLLELTAPRSTDSETHSPCLISDGLSVSPCCATLAPGQSAVGSQSSADTAFGVHKSACTVAGNMSVTTCIVPTYQQASTPCDN